MPILHEWNGTVLTITSDAGTSSCDLKGDKGDMGIRGAQGAQGEKSGITLEQVYPVGSIYISVLDTNPAELFKFGTWEQIQDKFLLGAGSSYANGSTGGKATHTLTASEIPSHTHTYYRATGVSSSQTRTSSGSAVYALTDVGLNTTNAGTGSVGSGQAHNNMPPYIAVCIWKRTA